MQVSNEKMIEAVIPIDLGYFNVLLTIFSEVFILVLGTLQTKALYSILIKRRIHSGKAARLMQSKWRQAIPFVDDLVFKASFNGALIFAIRIVLIALTFTASLAVGSRRTFDLKGEAESKIVVNNRTRASQWNFGGSSIQPLAKQGCEEINDTNIMYKSAWFSRELDTFSCSEGKFEESQYIIIIKWNIDRIPKAAQDVNIRHSIFNYTTKEFQESNETRISSSETDYLIFKKSGNRQFMYTTIRGGVSLEIVKPLFEDMYVYSANQINWDKANNLAPGLAVARSLSNHMVDEAPVKSTTFMTGKYSKEIATLSARGVVALAAAAFIVLIVLPLMVLILRRKVSYIRIDFMDSLGIASLCVGDEEKKCAESLEDIEFAIMDKGTEQHLGVLPHFVVPVKRDANKPMCQKSEKGDILTYSNDYLEKYF